VIIDYLEPVYGIMWIFRLFESVSFYVLLPSVTYFMVRKIMIAFGDGELIVRMLAFVIRCLMIRWCDGKT